MLDEFLSYWVKPVYQGVSGARGRLALGEREAVDALVPALRERLERVDDAVVSRLLSEFNWRPRVVGAWLVGLRRWDAYTKPVSELLLASELVYVGAEYAFALARIGTPEAADGLVRYLDVYLERPDLWYDQNTALAALRWLDGQHGERRAARYLGPGGAWERFTENKPDMDNEAQTRMFAALMDWSNQHFP